MTAVITEDAVLLAVLAVTGLRAAARLLSRPRRRKRPEGDRVPAPPVPAGRGGRRAYPGATRPQSQLVRPYVLPRAPRRPARGVRS